jgi:hypothetical protein
MEVRTSRFICQLYRRKKGGSFLPAFYSLTMCDRLGVFCILGSVCSHPFGFRFFKYVEIRKARRNAA